MSRDECAAATKLDDKRPACRCEPWAQRWKADSPERCANCSGMFPAHTIEARRPQRNESSAAVALLPALEHAPRLGCLNCGSKSLRVKMNARLHAGFGVTALVRDGECVESHYDYETCPTFMHFENVARKDADHDWRVRVDGPLSDVTYQRHGLNEWVAVEKGMGFA
jgi:hypothetical protein